MTRAICIKCGNEKHGSWTPCRECRYQPFGVPDVAWSLILSDHYLSGDTLDWIGQYIVANKRLPLFEAEEINTLYQRAEETVLASSRSLSKRGLLPKT